MLQCRVEVLVITTLLLSTMAMGCAEEGITQLTITTPTLIILKTKIAIPIILTTTITTHIPIIMIITPMTMGDIILIVEEGIVLAVEVGQVAVEGEGVVVEGEEVAVEEVVGVEIDARRL